MSEISTDEQIKDAVRQAYGQAARRFIEQPAQASCCGPAPVDRSCCAEPASSTEAIAQRFYSAEELADLPESAAGAALGCGNPVAIAELQPGEVVLDLGSGGGIDCFLAAKRVGPEGKVIGLDMTPDMIKLARRNAAQLGVANVDFRYGEMEEIPLPDGSVDVIISNCVINLSPDKDAVFREAYRVLRPGGRMMVSDIVVDGDLPRAVRQRLDAWAGCVAGALDQSVYLDKIRAAGFEQIDVLSRDSMPSAEKDASDAQLTIATADGQIITGEEAQAIFDELEISPQELARKIASIRVRAYKPG